MRARHVQRAQARAQLLGPDGNPIQPKQEIPFIQWLPDGKSTGRTIDRGSKVYADAAKFIARGGRYACVLYADGRAEIVAGFALDDSAKGEMLAIADETVPDGPAIGPAIDRVVAASVARMDNYTLTSAA